MPSPQKVDSKLASGHASILCCFMVVPVTDKLWQLNKRKQKRFQINHLLSCFAEKNTIDKSKRLNSASSYNLDQIPKEFVMYREKQFVREDAVAFL